MPMHDLTKMQELVARCPWLNADNLLAAAHENEKYQTELSTCWREIIDSGTRDDLLQAIQFWNDAGVLLTVEFILGVYGLPDLDNQTKH